MHGCCPGPFEAPGHSCTQLPGRLAHSGPLQGVSELSQGCRPPQRLCSWPQNKHQEECSLPFLTNSFLGVRLDSVKMQACLAPARISSLNTCLARFKLDHYISVSTCRRLLSLMAAASHVLTLGLLHMRLFLWWMKLFHWRFRSKRPATHLIRVSRSFFRAFLIWRNPLFLQSGVRMGAIHRRQMVTMDAWTGWSTVFECRVHVESG